MDDSQPEPSNLQDVFTYETCSVRLSGFDHAAIALACPRKWYHLLNGDLIAATGHENRRWRWGSVAQGFGLPQSAYSR
jgi:hypothetical protein